MEVSKTDSSEDSLTEVFLSGFVEPIPVFLRDCVEVKTVSVALGDDGFVESDEVVHGCLFEKFVEVV